MNGGGQANERTRAGTLGGRADKSRRGGKGGEGRTSGWGWMMLDESPKG